MILTIKTREYDMTGSFGARLGVATVVSLLSVGCGSADTNPIAMGTEGGSCYPNGTCNAGLDCVNTVCIRPGSATDVLTPDATTTDIPFGTDTGAELAPGQICNPGKSYCQGSVLYTCDELGMNLTTWDCANDGLDCQGDKCVSKPVSCVRVRPMDTRTNEPVPASVAVVFAVDDCEGAPVIGLDMSNFLVYEDGKKISPSESSATILDRGAEIYVSLVVDNSPSVRTAGALPQMVAAAKAYVEQVMGGASVYVGVWVFSKELESRQDYTNDKVFVLGALEELLTDETGSNTTNLYGSLVKILDESRNHQQQRRNALLGGITTLGQVVLFTDGSDQASVKTFEEAQEALDASADDVLTIALGGELEVDVLSALGRNGSFVAQTANELQAQFEQAALQTKGLQQRVYILGYCSPKLAGEHTLAIEVVSGEATLGQSSAVEFDASKFGSGTVECSPTTFAQACDGKQCGGLLCGSCSATGVCNGSTFECRCATNERMQDDCATCLSRFTGSDCGQCSAKFTGEDCEDCADPRFASPSCTDCLPRFTGDFCTECADPECSGQNCMQGTRCNMVEIPAGPFMQGCYESVDTSCGSDEKPYHQVTVPAFEIDKYEVTVDLYGDCVTGGGCTASTGTSSYCNQGKSGKSDHPMNCITWYQAREYCAWAGKRLCSESEWEKASRGTDGRKYPWGNETATCDYAVMHAGGYGCGENSTWPVGSKPAGVSPYGALDLSGNVWEWVEDEWHSDYTDAPTNGSAWVNDPRASGRVVRGGGVYNFGDDDALRSSARYAHDPAHDYDYFGARCCRSK